MPNKQLQKQLALREVVRRAVGFLHPDDLKRTKGGNADQLKDKAHPSHSPFHIILRLTAKAIEEEGDGRKWHHQLHDLQRYVSSEDAEVCGSWEQLTDELGMQRWHVLYDAHKLDKAQEGEEPQPILPDCRWVLDIVTYCCEEEEASNQKQYAASPGFNKREDSIVVLLPLSEFMQRVALSQSRSAHPAHPRSVKAVVNTARFSAMLTAFLAAMGPGVPHRFLVIKYAIQELLLFEFQTTLDDDENEVRWLPSKLDEWWALHILRRMFRMRFGCSLFPQPEQSGRIQDIRLQEDLGWQAYKNGVSKPYRQLGR